MLKQSDITLAIDTYQKNMAAAVTAARGRGLPTPISERFRTGSLGKAERQKILKHLPSLKKPKKEPKERGFLYLFLQSDGCHVSRSALETALRSARETQQGEGYPGKKNLCALNDDAPASRVLYLGRSWDVRPRVNSHLTASKGGTYAIHFDAWARDLDMAVDLHVYEFSGIEDGTLQVIEDGLWDHLRPLLGKRGER